jgi:ADP-heptose:LPS heptosyltransferase
VRILVVRRDNIGDLVITTPVFRALRSRFPGARIEVLVNSYNAPVLENHPDVDAIHAYVKSKHRETGTALGGWLARVRQLAGLRETGFDLALVPRPGYHPREIRLARWVAPRQLAAFVARGRKERGVHLPMESRQWDGTHHHLEDTFRLLEVLGIQGPPPAPRLAISAASRTPGAPLVIGIHASARRPSSRWPPERIAPLMRLLNERLGATFRLFWAPGEEDDPRHPGDDGCARRIVAASQGLPVAATPTRELRELIQGLAACDALVCSDGGAMHIAAALGKPIVCFFGDSEAYHWHPWAVPHRLLQPPSLNAADVTLEQAAGAFIDLAAESGLA